MGEFPHTDEFAEWYAGLSELQQNDLTGYWVAADGARSSIGGDKTGNGRFYERTIPIADTLYDVYIGEIRRRG